MYEWTVHLANGLSIAIKAKDVRLSPDTYYLRDENQQILHVFPVHAVAAITRDEHAKVVSR